jgi:hypothetical protein
MIGSAQLVPAGVRERRAHVCYGRSRGETDFFPKMGKGVLGAASKPCGSTKLAAVADQNRMMTIGF